MNRLVKYRIWSLELETWISDCSVENICDIKNDINSCFDNKHLIFQLFIGLKDKNNKEIYEGDLINFTLRGMTHGPESEDIKDAEVFWDEKNLCFCFGRYKTNDYIDYSFCFADRIDRNSIEVVGNIFENPELLKT